jgi:hypothetical protein
VDVRLDCMGSLACLEMVVNPVSSLEQWWRPGGRSARLHGVPGVPGNGRKPRVVVGAVVEAMVDVRIDWTEFFASLTGRKLVVVGAVVKVDFGLLGICGVFDLS